MVSSWAGKLMMREPLTSSRRKVLAVLTATGRCKASNKWSTLRNSSPDWRKDGLHNSTNACGCSNATCSAKAAEGVDLPACREHNSKIRCAVELSSRVCQGSGFRPAASKGSVGCSCKRASWGWVLASRALSQDSSRSQRSANEEDLGL